MLKEQINEKRESRVGTGRNGGELCRRQTAICRKGVKILKKAAQRRASARRLKGEGGGFWAKARLEKLCEGESPLVTPDASISRVGGVKGNLRGKVADA